MTIYHVKENTCYQANTTALAIPEICRRKGIECITYTIEQFWAKHLQIDHDPKAVFIIEAAFGHNRGWNVAELRRFIPNGKIVCLGGDTIWFLKTGEKEAFEYNQVDLWLDLMSEVVEQFRYEGLRADLWKWTISEVYIERIKKWFADVNLMDMKYKKNNDLICLMTLNNHYRKSLDNYLKSVGRPYIFGNGVFSSHDHDLFPAYLKSWVCLGTSSPAWTDDIRTMKGFRDWIAPFLGTVLIYDDHPQILSEYGGGTVVPIYQYYDFPSIFKRIDELKSDGDGYRDLLDKQKSWALSNSLETQFERLLTKHGIV